MSDATMTASRRESLLEEAFVAGAQYSEIDALLFEAETDGADTARLTVQREHHHDKITKLLHEYRDGLPRPELTRCPYTSTAVRHSIDSGGLDGFWWNFNGATRQLETDLPPTWFALTGAVRLAGPVRSAPILCKPGPEVPYVLPRILDHDALTAVVSSVAIGEHEGFAIAYFAKPVPWDLPRVNTWGANHFWYVGEDGEWGWDDEPLLEEDMDFDLEPWIDSGRLRWIAPGDSRLVVREGSSGCPYLDLPGRREILRIEDGAVWTRQEVE